VCAPRKKKGREKKNIADTVVIYFSTIAEEKRGGRRGERIHHRPR